VLVGDKYGFIDKQGKFVIDPKFDFADSFSDGMAVVRIGDEESGKQSYIDSGGKIISTPQFDQISAFAEGLAAVRVGDDKTGKYGYISRQCMNCASKATQFTVLLRAIEKTTHP